jgi:hypothetical protein
VSAGLKTAARLAHWQLAHTQASKEPSCSEIEVIMRDFESGLGVFADDGAFAFSRPQAGYSSSVLGFSTITALNKLVVGGG